MHRPLLVLIGPSGAGKSALADRLARAGAIATVPTWTTRPRRPDESSGSPNHRFVGEEVFDRLERAGAFVGVVRLPGLPHRYGLPAVDGTGGPLPAVVARAPFVAALRDHFPLGPTYQVERSAAATIAALAGRGTSAAEEAARFLAVEDERLAGRALADRWFANDGTSDDLATRVAAALAGAGVPA